MAVPRGVGGRRWNEGRREPDHLSPLGQSLTFALAEMGVSGDFEQKSDALIGTVEICGNGLEKGKDAVSSISRCCMSVLGPP